MAKSEPENMSFGARLRELMSAKGYIARTLASDSGLSEGAVSRLFSRTKSPRVQTAMAICDVLGCRLKYLMSGIPPKWEKGQEPSGVVASPDKRRRENRSGEKRTESGELSIPTIREPLRERVKIASSAPPTRRS